MGQGEAIAFGEGVSMPSRNTFDRQPIDAVPRTTTATFSESWANELEDDGFLADVVARWRVQSHFSFADPVRHPNEDAGATSPADARAHAARPAAGAPAQPFGRAAAEPTLTLRGFGATRGLRRSS
jgi:hypothetical protein